MEQRDEKAILATIDTGYGALADVPGSVDDFLREKHADTQREEERDRLRWEEAGRA